MATVRKRGDGRTGVAARTNPDDHLAYLLARVHRRLEQAMDRELRAVDITPTQFYALAHLAQSPELSSADLARALMTSPQAAATLVTRLGAAGLVERDQSGRGVPAALRLTASGRAKLASAAKVAVAAESAALSSLPEREQQRVATSLRTLLAGLEHG